MFKTLLKYFKPAFDCEKVICRIIAAWCSFVAMTLLTSVAGESFTELKFAQDTSISKMAMLILVLFCAYTVIAAAFEKFQTDSWFLMLSASVCVFKWLNGFAGNKNVTLLLLAVVVAYMLFVIYFLWRNEILFSKWQPSKRATAIFAAVCGLGAGAVIAAITCLRYETYSSPNYDFGLFCNMFHYMKETGLPLVTSERDALLSHFAVHISPIYYILLPFYYIFPSPLTLQIGQAAVLASGVIPVLLLARHYKLSGKITMIVTAIYAFYPVITGGCFYDIHENCFLAPLLLWLFYFFETKKTIPMYIFALAVLLVKEDAMVYIVFFALYAIISRRRYLHGSIMAIGALVYFGFATYMLTNYGDGVMVNRFNNLIFDSNDGLVGAVKTALVNPGFLLSQLFTTQGDNWDKIVYFLQLFLPLGFIPFCTKKWSRWLLLVPTLVNLLTYYVYQYNIGFQYSFGIAAFLVYAMVQNIADLKGPTKKTLISIGAVSCACMYIMLALPKYNTYNGWYNTNKDTYERMDEILDTIPKDASVCASSFLVAHLSDREEIYEVNYHVWSKDDPEYDPNNNYKNDTDYIVLDGRYKIDDLITKYTELGYTVTEQHKGLITIMKKA